MNFDKKPSYYVYAILDQRKHGHYCYDGLNCSFLYEPIYIGKGKGSRIKKHFQENVLKQDTYKNNKVKKIKRETGNWPIIIKIKENINEKDAFILEEKIIKIIGRKCDNGPLTNIATGGLSNTPIFVGEDVHNSNFTNEQVKYIRNNVKDNNKSVKEIANEYNVSILCIYNLLKNITYYDPNYIPLVFELKFSKEKILEIRNNYKYNNISVPEIALREECSTCSIYEIIYNVTYYDPDYTPPENITNLGEKSVFSKFTNEYVNEVRELYKNGKINIKEIAKVNNTSYSTARKMIKNITYTSNDYNIKINKSKSRSKYAKFSDCFVNYIRNQVKYNNKTVQHYANLINVHYNTIHNIITNYNYYDPKYIPPNLIDHSNKKYSKSQIKMFRKLFKKLYEENNIAIKKFSKLIKIPETTITRILKNRSYFDPNYTPPKFKK